MPAELKPIIKAPLNRIAEIDGTPVAFMLTFPNMNDIMAKIDGKLFPFGWFHLLRWLKNPQGAGMRVPLMGVSSDLHNSRTASQLAFMMIEDIREQATTYGSTREEVGWVLDDVRADRHRRCHRIRHQPRIRDFQQGSEQGQIYLAGGEKNGTSCSTS